ncbi:MULTISPECIES: acetyl-CoA acetyltransferase [Euryhalocaulis]|uniref:acetyl-CoA acetyltransferase n=1 Tax=Euryhalocaulis TaxID=1712422 RepID=UPI00039C11B9|nr:MULTISPECIES: acetyl-CoA acetyltransferase [Euryhalocaulis]MBA4800458.1 thiolase domain-containing protein [Euryhalocaulis sp.]
MTRPVYILGGWQSDFSENWMRQDKDIMAAFKDAVDHALDATGIDPADVETGHVGNFVGELFNHQGLMGGFFGMCREEWADLPTGRHEAACASGSIALLAASAEIEAGRYDLACVVGLEQMRNVPGIEAAGHLGAAIWSGHEFEGVAMPWPHIFAKLGDEYDRRYGLKHEHLAGIAKTNFENARRNPNAQTRKWEFTEASFTTDDEANPVIDGRIRKQDCGQITDGVAVAFLASEDKARAYAKQRGLKLEDLAKIEGWGHHSAPIAYQAKIDAGGNSPYIFPHIRQTVVDAQSRAGTTLDAVDVIETHDCFTTTEYMAIDHFGLTAPGESWKAVEDGVIAIDGEKPINPSGGLIGTGHPVGATGVRMALDGFKQVTRQAGGYQVDGVERVQTLNIGGSATTAVSFVIGRGEAA